MKITRKLTSLATILITFASLAGGANAAITVTNISGDDYLADIGTLNFTVTTAGVFRVLTVEDYYVGPNTDRISTPLMSNITYSLNGSAPVSIDLIANSGSYGSTIGVWDPNDFLFATASGISVSMGDQISLSGTFTFNASGLTSPVANPGDLVSTLAEVDLTTVLSNGTVSSVPEASSALLLGIGALGIISRRKRIA